ncbi:MAG: hypothetical protein HUU46_02400 [Candidatus Hydrogenedentes bacterium]|nr:hypothetical protein [Candidatus Hydrogenedentota bacterium]
MLPRTILGLSIQLFFSVLLASAEEPRTFERLKYDEKTDFAGQSNRRVHVAEKKHVEFLQQTVSRFDNYEQFIIGKTLILQNDKSRRFGPYNLAGKNATATVAEFTYTYQPPRSERLNHHNKEHHVCPDGPVWNYRMYFRFHYDNPQPLDMSSDLAKEVLKVSQNLIVTAYQGNTVIAIYELVQDQSKTYAMPPELLVDDLYFEFSVKQDAKEKTTDVTFGQAVYGINSAGQPDKSHENCATKKDPPAIPILDEIKGSFDFDIVEF